MSFIPEFLKEKFSGFLVTPALPPCIVCDGEAAVGEGTQRAETCTKHTVISTATSNAEASFPLRCP